MAFQLKIRVLGEEKGEISQCPAFDMKPAIKQLTEND